MMTTIEATASRQFCVTAADVSKRTEIQALQTAIEEALSHAGYRELRGLGLECDGETITISGRVPTYYLKQLVQSIALSAPGVGRVNNDVRVC